MKKTKAFTLVELLVVISIIGIVAGLLIPAVMAIKDSKKPSVNHIPKSENPFRPNTPVVTQSAADNSQMKGGEAIPITLHGLKYTIIYHNPDEVEIYRQKECEDATVGTTNRTTAEK